MRIGRKIHIYHLSNDEDEYEYVSTWIDTSGLIYISEEPLVDRCYLLN